MFSSVDIVCCGRWWSALVIGRSPQGVNVQSDVRGSSRDGDKGTLAVLYIGYFLPIRFVYLRTSAQELCSVKKSPLLFYIMNGLMRTQRCPEE